MISSKLLIGPILFYCGSDSKAQRMRADIAYVYREEFERTLLPKAYSSPTSPSMTQLALGHVLQDIQYIMDVLWQTNRTMDVEYLLAVFSEACSGPESLMYHLRYARRMIRSWGDTLRSRQRQELAADSQYPMDRQQPYRNSSQLQQPPPQQPPPQHQLEQQRRKPDLSYLLNPSSGQESSSGPPPLPAPRRPPHIIPLAAFEPLQDLCEEEEAASSSAKRISTTSTTTTTTTTHPSNLIEIKQEPLDDTEDEEDEKYKYRPAPSKRKHSSP